MKPSTRSLTLGTSLSFALVVGACGADVVTATGSTTSGAGTSSGAGGHGGADTTSASGAGGQGGGGTGGQGGGGGSGGAFSTGTPAPARIASGAAHTCVIRADATVRCWGDNGYGQLGDGTKADSSVPVTVKGLSGAESLDASDNHTCAVLADATVRCWGKNGNFELGAGTQVDSAVPVAAKGLTGVVALALGTDIGSPAGHSCAIVADGTLRCWGSDHNGAFGDGTQNDSATPVAAVGIGNVVAVSSYGTGVYVALADGTLFDWGNWSIVPHLVDGGIVNAVSVSAGLLFGCALLLDGTVRCWGHNFEGQLGQGGMVGQPASQTPLVVPGVERAVAIGSGQDHTCAVLDNGRLRCWGWNYQGQLGNGTMSINPPVVEPVGVHHVVGVAGGSGHTCALLESGAVRCWGANGNGQLGNGTMTDSLVAVDVVGL